MDFKSIISKLDSMDAPKKTPAAPLLPQAMQLNEDAQLRVLSGRTTYVAEAKKKEEAEVKEATKTDKPWKDSSGKEHPGTAVKGDKYKGDEAEKEEKSKKKDESIEPTFKSKFMKMVEAKKSGKKKPDDDNDGVPNWADEKPGEDDNEGKKKGAKPKKGVNPFAKKESVKEATKTDKPWTDKSGKQHPGTAVKGDKYKGDEAEKEEKSKKTDESKMMPKGKKRPVKESVEGKLSFREMMNLVVESGGQQQIDAVDQELFAWAQRVAKQKIGEGMKAEVYAGLVYERMGGKFEMFDVLSEDQK
jgi:hypothetical protein